MPISTNSYSSKITSAKVKVGQRVNGYEVTLVSGTTIKVQAWGDLYGDFFLPKAADLWNGAVKSDYVSWVGVGSSEKTEGDSAMLPKSNASAYYHFNTAESVGEANGGFWTFNLKCNANGGIGAPETQTYGTDSKSNESHIFTISATVPTRTGYTFKGWSNTSDDSVEYGGGDEYLVKQTVSDYKGGSVTKTLYAVWEKKGEIIDNSKVKLTKTPSEDCPEVGEEFKFTIKAENENNVPLTVRIVDRLDKRLEFVRVSELDGGEYSLENHTVTWPAITVSANGSEQVIVWVRATEAGEIPNTVNAFWEEGSADADAKVNVTAPQYTVIYRWTGLSSEATETLPAGGVYTEGAAVTDADKTVGNEGYQYVGDDYHENGIQNVLSAALERENTVLKLYFTKELPKPFETEYRVEWYVVGQNAPVKTETRTGTIGQKVEASEMDKSYSSYVFVTDHDGNILSIEELTEAGGVLKLYFDRKDTSYTVVHEYYTNGRLSGSVQSSSNGKVGDVPFKEAVL